MANFKDMILGSNFRVIAISDIHGNINGLKDILKKSSFNYDKDILVIVGDILEKGTNNLETLRFVMNLTKTTRTYVVLGNCDTILIDVYKNELHDEIKQYMLNRNKCILVEMCNEIGFTLSPEMDMFDMYDRLNKNFKEEISFVVNLPIAIETEEYIFAHGGIEPREDYRNSAYDYILCHDRFYETDYQFTKKVIAGHWPTCFYGEEVFDCSPIIDHYKNIICIDGGNSTTPFGQINALIIENDGIANLSFVSSDSFKQVPVVKNQLGTQGRKIAWPYNQFEIHSETEKYYTGNLQSYATRGYIPGNLGSYIITVPKNLVYQDNGKFYIYECMNELLELKVGDSVKIIFDNGYDILICKFSGRIGLVQRDILGLK